MNLPTIAVQYHYILHVSIRLCSRLKYLVGLDTIALSTIDREGNTALQHACRGAEYETISLLLDSLMPYQYYPNGALTRSFESIIYGKSIQWKKREQRMHEVHLSASASLPGDCDDVGTNRGGFCFASVSTPTISMYTS
eukprot:scaffold2221_cov91-Skeletonema_dohrnii-CCMP3373.AAC.3